MTWILENWELCALVVVGVLSAVNRATVHYTALQGGTWNKLLLTAPLVLLDLVSVLRSRGSEALTKMPGTPEVRTELQKLDADNFVALSKTLKIGLLVLAMGATACSGGWQQSTLKTLNVVVAGADAAHVALESACRPVAAYCHSQGRKTLAKCPELQSCWNARRPLIVGLYVVLRGIQVVTKAIKTDDAAGAVHALADLYAAYEDIRAAIEKLRDTAKTYTPTPTKEA